MRASILSAGVAGLLAVASLGVQAADRDSGFYALGGVGVLNPNAGELSTETAPTAAVGYAFSPQWAVEVGGPLRAYREKISVGGAGEIASFKARPYEASVLYHFGDHDVYSGSLSPYVGLGYAWTRTTDERGQGLLAGVPVSLDSADGALGRVGLDYRFNSNWFARADATYLDTDAKAHVAGFGTGELSGNSWKYGLQVGYAF